MGVAAERRGVSALYPPPDGRAAALLARAGIARGGRRRRLLRDLPASLRDGEVRITDRTLGIAAPEAGVRRRCRGIPPSLRQLPPQHRPIHRAVLMPSPAPPRKPARAIFVHDLDQAQDTRREQQGNCGMPVPEAEAGGSRDRRQRRWRRPVAEAVCSDKESTRSDRSPCRLTTIPVFHCRGRVRFRDDPGPGSNRTAPAKA